MFRGTAFAISVTLAAGPAIAEPHGYVGQVLCGYGLQTKGCDTSYEEGASALRLDETTARITAKGNGRTKPDAVYQFVMRKAAETTLAAGYDLFQVVDQADTTQHLSGVEGGGSNGNGGSFPVQSYNITKPGQAMIIKLARGPKPVDATASVFDAREVLKFMQMQQPR